MAAAAEVLPSFRITNPLEGLGDTLRNRAEEAWRNISYQEARSEVVPDLLSYVSRLDSLLSTSPAEANEAALQTRKGVARMVALGLLAERAASDAMFRRGSATIFPGEDTQSWLAAVGIHPAYLEGLDREVTGALEASLFRDTQTVGRLNAHDSVFPLGNLSERSLGFLFRNAYSRAKDVLLSSKHRDKGLASQIEISLFQAIEHPEAAYQAVEETANLLLPLVGGEAPEPLFKRNRPEAAALYLLYRGLPLDERLALLADPQMKMRVNGGGVESVPAIMERVGGELGNIFAWAGAKETWNAFNEETKRTLVFLASHVDAPLTDRVKILLQQPGLLRVLQDLPSEVQEHFAPIVRDAAIVAGMVSETAEVYALTKLNLPGWAQKAGRDIVNFFSVQAGTPGSDGPRRPHRGRVGVVLVVVASIVAGCIGVVADQQTKPPPGVGITPGPDTPMPGPSLTPLSPDATPMAIGPSPTAFVGGWTVGDFPRIAPLVAPDSFLPSRLPSDFTVRMQDLIAFEKDDPRCAGANCNTLVAVSPLNGDTRAAYFLQSPDGALYVAVRNPDGSFNRVESEWVPALTTYDGKKLTPVWLFDFQIDPKSGKPVAVGGSQAISRLGFAIEGGNGLDGQDPVVALWSSPFGDGVTQLLVKDPARLFGTAFPHVDSREFMLIVDANGEMTGGYYQYGPDGRVLLTAPSQDAKGTFGKWKLQEKDGTWKWEWLAASIATSTSEATATMAPIPVVSEFITGVKPVKSYDFNQNANGVSYPSASVFWMRNGTMQIEGLQTWGSNLRFDTAIQAGQAVVLDFKSGDTSVVFIDVGNFGDPAYRRVGFNVKGGKLLDDTFRGKTYDMSPLSGTLGTIKPDTWYKAMFAVGPDGTVRMVIWDPTDSTKRVVHDVANPDIAGKPMNLTLGAYSGALIIDQADVFKFDALIKLPETPVPVQPTARPPAPTAVVLPTPGGQPPVVNPPDNQQNLTPQPDTLPTTLSGYGKLDYRNMWICGPCRYAPELASKNNNPNVNQVFIKIRDPATLTWIGEAEEYTGAGVVNAESRINTLVASGYKPLATNWGQRDDPRVVGVHPHTVTIIFDHP